MGIYLSEDLASVPPVPDYFLFIVVSALAVLVVSAIVVHFWNID